MRSEKIGDWNWKPHVTSPTLARIPTTIAAMAAKASRTPAV